MKVKLTLDGWIVFLIMEALVVLGGICAYNDNFFFPNQMIHEKGFSHGLPFIGHMGMWGDLLFMSPLLAVIWSTHAPAWKFRTRMGMFFLGMVISMIMHVSYATKSPFPGCHAYNGHLTSAGIVHFVYMTVALTILLLLVVQKEKVERKLALTISIGLSIFIFLGTECVLGIWNPSWYAQQPLVLPITWLTLVPAWGIIGIWCYRTCRTRTA